MEKPWLIQRCSLKTTNKEEINGIDSYLRPDYTGSAEFEYGALPKAIKRILGVDPVLKNNLDLYKIREVVINKTPFFILCKEEDYGPIAQFLVAEVDSAISPNRLQEGTRLRQVLEGNEYYQQFRIWWDIENDWFVGLDKKEMELLSYALEVTELKKK